MTDTAAGWGAAARILAAVQAQPRAQRRRERLTVLARRYANVTPWTPPPRPKPKPAPPAGPEQLEIL